MSTDMQRIDDLITELEAQAQRDVHTGRSVLDRHPARESARSALLGAIRAEFESLTSSLRAVDAKVVEWRERAQTGEERIEMQGAVVRAARGILSMLDEDSVASWWAPEMRAEVAKLTEASRALTAWKDARRASAPPRDPEAPLAEWYEADGSTVMLPAEEVTRRRKLAAKVLDAARRVEAADTALRAYQRAHEDEIGTIELSNECVEADALLLDAVRALSAPAREATPSATPNHEAKE